MADDSRGGDGKWRQLFYGKVDSLNRTGLKEIVIL